ncbi:MAG TPA: hypothetical protein VHD91_11235, partial [Gaiellaceae bacterium]|nr:hypothetical protein [Gaiellaceae bacterium]
AAVPVYVAFLPKRYGYAFTSDKGGAFVGMSLGNVVRTFSDSPLWSPRTLAFLVPPALAGLAAVRRDAAVLLGGWLVVNSFFYSLAPNTYFQPRYLFAGLPALLVLIAAGLAGVVALLARKPFGPDPRFSGEGG